MKNITYKSQIASLAIVSTIAIVMTGCATKPTYQMSSQSGINQAGINIVTNTQGVPNYYQVKRGDTVSQIATRYRLDYRQIGAMNGLDSRYTIYSGQMLKLWQNNNATNNNSSVATLQPSLPTYNTTPVATPAPVQTPVYETTANSTSGYQYPSRNQIIRNFDAQTGNIGMWFAGTEGDPVLASQSGTVLYSGNGLSEYGNLIMIRHSNNYITAYAHNSQLLVSEGDQVQGGQRIGSMGRSGQTDQVALQFQVRLNGTPIDPRAVLGR